MTPHLGASTAEATDRAGYQAAEQVVAALTGGAVTTRGQHARGRARGHGGARPVPAAGAELGRIAVALAEGRSVDALEVEYLGRIAERDTRLLTVQVLKGALAGPHRGGRQRRERARIAAGAGIEVAETRRSEARDFSDLVRVTVVSGSERTRVVGTVLGSRNRPHLLEAWGSRFNVQLENTSPCSATGPAGDAGPRRQKLGDANVNIVSAAVGWKPEEDGDAVMVVTADAAIPQEVVDQIAATDGFIAGRTVSL